MSRASFSHCVRHSEIVREVTIRNGSLIGWIVRVHKRDDVGVWHDSGTFYVQKKTGAPRHAHNYGLNHRYMPESLKS